MLWLWEGCRKAARRWHACAIERAVNSAVESLVSRRGSWVASARCPDPGLQVPAIVEPLEHRVHLSATFNCYMSAVVSGRTVTVILWTTGGKASQYVVNWNDPNTNGTISATYTAPSDGSPLTKSYTYKGAYTGAITTVATLSGTNTTATAYYALDGSFGTFQASGTGATRWNPNGNTNTVGQTSAVVDTIGGGSDPLLNDVFVAHSYYPTGGGGPLIGITALSAYGQFDSKFGSYNNAANNGTYVVPSFGGGSDVPYAMAMAVDGGANAIFLIVVGKCSRGWAICVINTERNNNVSGTNYGNPKWDLPIGSTPLDGGQANAVEMETTDGTTHFAVAGTDGTHMVVANLNLADGTPFNTNWGTSGLVTVPFAGGHANFQDNIASGNSILELDDQVAVDPGEELIVAGCTYFSCGGTCGCGAITGSDFTIVEIGDESATVDATLRTNIGLTLSSSPSTDAAYGVVAYEPVGAHINLTAVGQTNYWGADHFTLEQYDFTTGALVSSFGQHSGIDEGPAGDANAVLMPAFSSAGEFFVTGAAGGDILTAAFANTGSLESSGSSAFGNGGLWYQDLGDSASANNSTDIGWSLTFLADGSLLVCGTTVPNGQSNRQIALTAYTLTNQAVVT